MKQNVNHIDHVIWICKPENQSAYVKQLSELCNVRFHGPVDKESLGVRIYISWAAGLEVVTPLSDSNPNAKSLQTHLNERGEGILGVVFGVPDIGEGRTRAQGLGYPVSDIIENVGDEPYVHETECMKEVIVGNIASSLFILGEIRYADNLL